MSVRTRSRGVAGCLALVVAVTIAGCEANVPRDAADEPASVASNAPSPSPSVVPATPTPSPEPTPTDNPFVTERPAWLGKRVLPPGIDGFGEIRPTPRILRNRRFATIDLFPPPKTRRFRATIGPIPPDVVKRSSWRPRCPVSLEELSYVKMPFWGFDRNRHMGELIVNASEAEEVVEAFRVLYRARFPIEEMRVVTRKEVDEWETKPTGDVNVTSSFECREAAQSSHWSQHAYGLALDINPFHNPYLRGPLVAPELASAYTDRSWVRPGMIVEGDAVTRAFDAAGWQWGGRWNTLKDWMHFSLTGR
jgi:hypothetical protein